MPNWKKLVVSGSDASLNTLNLTSTPNSTGDFLTRGSNGQITSRTAAQVLADINAVPTNRTITIGSSSAKNLTSNVSFTLSEIGAQAAGNFVTIDTTQTITGAKTFSSAIIANGGVTRASTLNLSATGNNIVKINTNGSERLRVTGNGNVGIGITNPILAKLQVNGDISAALYKIDGEIVFDLAANNIYRVGDLGGIGNAELAFHTEVGEAVRIDDDGNVGIGITSPQAKLDISKSGGTVLNIEGSSGQLFSVTDSLTGVLMSVNDISGLPILEVSDNDKVSMGTFGAEGLIVEGSDVILPNINNNAGDILTLNSNNKVTKRTSAEILTDINAVPTNRTLTINGVTFNLSDNRTWSVGTVTSVSGGTGLTGTVTGSGSISLSSSTISDIGLGVTAHGWGDFRDFGLGHRSVSRIPEEHGNFQETGFYRWGFTPIGYYSGMSNNTMYIHIQGGGNRTARLLFEPVGSGNEPRVFVNTSDLNSESQLRRLWHNGNFSTSDIDNWNNAYSWGDHAAAGYAISGTGGSQVRTNTQLDARYLQSVNLGYTASVNNGVITNTGGNNATIPAATTSSAGLMTSADKTKLNGIATGATANTGTVTSITAGDGLSGGTITTSGTIAVDSTVVRTSGNQTIDGFKTFTDNIRVTGLNNLYVGGIVDDSQNGLRIHENAGIVRMDIHSTTDLYFRTGTAGATNSITLKGNNGRLGLGTTSPSHALHVAGRVRITTIDNGTGDFATISGTGVITRRTAAQVRTDIGAGTLSSVNLGYTTSATTGEITNTGGNNATIPAATTSSAGLMTSADKTKLNGIATGATANTGTVTSITADDGLSGGTITTSGTIAVDSTVVRTSGDQSIDDRKTFNYGIGFTRNDGHTIIPATFTQALNLRFARISDTANPPGIGAWGHLMTIQGWVIPGPEYPTYQLIFRNGAVSVRQSITTGAWAGWRQLVEGNGAGASGTWGISITGNAGTVTNGVYTTGNQTIGGVKTFSNNTIFNGDVGIGTTSPDEALHVAGRVRITTIDNGTGDFATISGTGVITRRTAAQVRTDIGAGTLSSVNLGYTTSATTGEITNTGGNNATIPAATTSSAGLMTNNDKSKLDGIEAGAQVNVGTNLGSSGTGGTRTITSSTGTNTSITFTAADLNAVPTNRTITINSGDGLTGGAAQNLGANRTWNLAVDSTVVRTSGDQTIDGNKTFITSSFGGILINRNSNTNVVIGYQANNGGPYYAGFNVTNGVFGFVDSVTAINNSNIKININGNITTSGTLSLQSSASTSAATQIPVFTANPASTTRTLVTRTPTQLLDDINAVPTNRTITVGSSSAKNLTSNVSFTLSEIGAQAAGNFVTLDTTQTITGIKTFSTNTGLIATDPMINSRGYTNNFSVMQWRYGIANSHRLRLKQTVTPDAVQWNFSQTNNNTNFEDVLVLDRGNVGIGTTSPSSKLQVAGDIRITKTILSNQENLTVNSGALRVIAQISSTNHDAVFFDYVIKKGNDLRAGTVYAVHNGTDVEFTETSTNDIGNTNEVVLIVDISGGNVRLLAKTDTNGWQIKTLTRGI